MSSRVISSGGLSLHRRKFKNLGLAFGRRNITAPQGEADAVEFLDVGALMVGDQLESS